jgi:excisionase family DNA binding protein
MEGMVIMSSEEVRKLIRDELVNVLPKIEAPDNRKRFYINEAAEYLGLPVESFRQHIRKVGGAKIGKRWTFTKDELDRYIERKSHKPVSEIYDSL